MRTLDRPSALPFVIGAAAGATAVMTKPRAVGRAAVAAALAARPPQP